jgi:MoaA/NifB/PqqE/SkfB family radical SAM enzyme
MRIHVFFYFLSELIHARMNLFQFIAVLRRLLYFISKLRHNKFVKIGNDTRIDLYIPGYPSEAFFTACKKFTVLKQKLPCSTVLLSVTSACRYHCPHCYQRRDQGKDADVRSIVALVKKLQAMGIAFFNIEGGEPFLVFERLLQVCQAVDKRSEIWINSTGDGITKEKLLRLQENNVKAIMFSLHSPEPEAFDAFMGKPGAWQTLVHAVEACNQTTIAVALNACLQKQDFQNGTFEKIMERAKSFNTAVIQLIKPKPSGNLLGQEGMEWNEEDRKVVKTAVAKYNSGKACRDYPVISAQIIEEDKDVFGCTAGGTDRFYVNAKGDVQPCEFLNISFGNIMRDDFETVYNRMRACFEVPGEHWLCEKYSGAIARLFQDNHLDTLPLDPVLAAPLHQQWERGDETELYRKLRQLGR